MERGLYRSLFLNKNRVTNNDTKRSYIGANRPKGVRIKEGTSD